MGIEFHFKPKNPDVLGGSSLSSHIRSIPAAQSEYAAINGLDPVMLAQLALKDAQRAATLTPDSVLPHVLQARAEEGRVQYPGRAAHCPLLIINTLALSGRHEHFLFPAVQACEME